MNTYIGNEFQKRWKLYQENNEDEFNTSIMDLAIESYINAEPPGTRRMEKLDNEFVKIVTRQIRLFLFAGHDTTSSAIVYCFHLLASNPSTLQRIREEHAKIFDSESSQLPSLISSNPRVLNNLA